MCCLWLNSKEGGVIDSGYERKMIPYGQKAIVFLLNEKKDTELHLINLFCMETLKKKKKNIFCFTRYLQFGNVSHFNYF